MDLPNHRICDRANLVAQRNRRRGSWFNGSHGPKWPGGSRYGESQAFPIEHEGTAAARKPCHASQPGGDYCIDRAEFKPTSLWQDLSPAEWLHRKMADNLYMQTATWLTSKEQTEAAGPWDTHLLSDDDVEYSCRVLLASEGTRFVPEARVFCRNTPSVTA